MVGHLITHDQVELSPNVSGDVVSQEGRQVLVLLSDHVPDGHEATQTRYKLAPKVRLAANRAGIFGQTSTQYLVDASAYVGGLPVINGHILTHYLLITSAKKLELIGHIFTHLFVEMSLKVLKKVRQSYMHILLPSSA